MASPTLSPRKRGSKAAAKRAIGIIRVSRVSGRAGDSFASPEDQRKAIERECERKGLELIDTVDESQNVSGGTPLAKREGLRSAIERIEAGEASIVLAAYFDRLFRSLDVQREVVTRVEAAGGQVLAVDVGQVTNGSASLRLSATMLGAVAEYQRFATSERVATAQQNAVARGAQPWARVPLGYRRRDVNPRTSKPTGPLVAHPPEVPIVRQAFQMRADGSSITQIRKMLKSHGVERSHRGVQVMLKNRIYLGEVIFGDFANLQAHEPIIDPELWGRVQRMVIPRGPQPSSTRLLSRLGVLRCGSCGARLSSMKLPQQGDYPIYRCPSTSDCEHHMTISAAIAEATVVEYVRKVLRNVEGRASAEASTRKAEQALASAQEALEAAQRAFDGMGDEAAVIEKLGELRKARDEAQGRVDQLGGAGACVSISGDRDWDLLTVGEQRALIRATIETATVNLGRGAERITITAA